ncbi:MAG: hypothetical protein L3J07_00435 [Candidatus Magasanikbacteria bacterium]|nr:hypothetical protein [Candidatus Magasanikbacteria bacterium]
MNRKTIVLGGVVAGIITILGVSTASAHFGGNNQSNIFPENREEIKQIIESKDYDAFKTHLEENDRTQMLEKITEEKFNKFLEMRELAESGDKDGAREIREELKLKKFRKNFNKAKRFGLQHEEMRQIIESRDYDALKTHLEENDRTQMLEKITEEKFDKFLEMKELAISGDREGAKKIADELGLERGIRNLHKSMHRQVQK